MVTSAALSHTSLDRQTHPGALTNPSLSKPLVFFCVSDRSDACHQRPDGRVMRRAARICGYCATLTFFRKHGGNLMATHTMPSAEIVFDTLFAYQRSAALNSAIELDLFTAIDGGDKTLAAIATRCG